MNQNARSDMARTVVAVSWTVPSRKMSTREKDNKGGYRILRFGAIGSDASGGFLFWDESSVYVTIIIDLEIHCFYEVEQKL
jgi:hypothetical protein